MSFWSWLGDNATSILGGVGDFVGSLFQNNSNQQIASQNIQFQREENAITRSREDNAVQRAAADMQAAGLSKTLAAGNPASAQALTAPQNSYKPNKLDLMNSFLQAKSLTNQLKKQEAEVKQIEAGTEGQNIANKYAEEGYMLDLEGKLVKNDIDRETLKITKILGENKANQIFWDIEKIKSDIAYQDKSTELKAREIAHYVAKEEKLAKETEMLVEDIAYKQLQQEALKHDLDVARAGNTFTSGDHLTWWERLVRTFNIANGNQSINVPHFDAETLGYDW